MTRGHEESLDNNQGCSDEDEDWVSLHLVELLTRIILEEK